MSHNIEIDGYVPPREPRISEMSIGESGYTVPWAYSPETGELDTGFTVYCKSGGTVSMLVTCTGIDNYKIKFTDKSYRY